MPSAFAARLESPYLRSACSGALALLAFYAPYAWPLIFFALVPVLHAAREAPSLRAAYMRGLPFSLIFIGGVTWWLLAALPAELPSFLLALAFSAGVVASWLLTVCTLAAVLALFFVAVRRLASRGLSAAFMLAGVFVMLEYGRMHAFNLLTLGPSVHNAPWFSFGFLGYPLADSSSWLQLASWGGVYALSFAVVWVNAFVAFGAGNARPRAFLALALVCIVAMLPLAKWRPAPRAPGTAAVGIMSLAPASADRSVRSPNYHTELARAVAALRGDGADLLAFPEGAELKGAEDALASVTVFGLEGPPQFAAAYKQGGEEQVLRTKLALVPQGEYQPWLFRATTHLLGLAHQAESMTGVLSYATGARTDARSHEAVPATVLLCSEAFAPMLGASIARETKSEYLVALLSHAWFGWAPTLAVDTRRALQVRAVEAGMPLVASGAYANGYAIDRYGRVREEIGRGAPSAWSVVSLKDL